MTAYRFDPREFYDVATTLSATHTETKYLRTAIGRAYYACFHLAKHGLERSGRWTAPTTNAHNAVIQELHRRNRFAIRDALRELKEIREIADYQLDVAVDQAVCGTAMAIAERLMRQVASF